MDMPPLTASFSVNSKAISAGGKKKNRIVAHRVVLVLHAFGAVQRDLECNPTFSAKTGDAKERFRHKTLGPEADRKQFISE